MIAIICESDAGSAIWSPSLYIPTSRPRPEKGERSLNLGVFDAGLLEGRAAEDHLLDRLLIEF